MDLNGEMERILHPPMQRLQASRILRFLLGLCWCLLHLLISVIHIGSDVIQVLECCIISSGLLEKYQSLHLHKLQYLAIVIDSEEAKNTTQIKELLHWLLGLGVKYVILYDMEGVLKKSLGTNSSCKSCSDADVKPVISLLHQERMTIELLSFSDGKEGAAKAASFLCSNYLKGDALGCNEMEPVFSETDMANALKAVGCGGPDPDLLLVYGPARCHLGFPAWRMRYTEIVHLGSIKFMKHAAIVKAIYDFSKKHQNYGT